jgi:hypothetical protein
VGVACLWREKAVRNLARNSREMYYAIFIDAEDILDDNGDYVGSTTEGYSEPVKFEAHLNAGRSSSRDDMFGVNVDYDRTITTVEMSLPISETSLIWHRTEPVLLDDGVVDPSSADYTVAAKPLDGRNHLLIAVKNRVKSSE